MDENSLFDIEFKEIVKKNRTTVPKVIQSRIDKTVMSIQKRTSLSKMIWYSSITAVLVIGCIIGTGFLSPVMAQNLKQIPLIGSLFKSVPKQLLQDGWYKTSGEFKYKYTDAVQVIDDAKLENTIYQYAVQFLPDYRGIKLHEMTPVHDKEVLKKSCLQELYWIKNRFNKNGAPILEQADHKYGTDNQFSQIKNAIEYMYQLAEDGLKTDNTQELTEAIQINSKLLLMLNEHDPLSKDPYQWNPGLHP